MEKIKKMLDISEAICVTTDVYDINVNPLIEKQKEESRDLITNYIINNHSKSYYFDNNQMFSMVPAYIKHMATGKYLCKDHLMGIEYVGLNKKATKFLIDSRNSILPIKNNEIVSIKDKKESRKYIYETHTSHMFFEFSDKPSYYDMESRGRWKILFVPISEDPEHYNRLYGLFALKCLYLDNKLTKDITNLIARKLFSFKLAQKIRIQNMKWIDNYISVSGNSIGCSKKADIWSVIHCSN